ncbi:MAG: hypothetical protein HY238_25210 [Acidobacteria bacterium]|nr:hypothetical protein [Acidobacteriota bacterium]
MIIELVYDQDCPNVTRARANLIRALAEAHRPVRWVEWDASSPEAPRRVRGFPSPTVLVDGRDVAGLEPGDGAAACRWGLPSVESIVRALRRSRRAWTRRLPVLAGAAGALLPKLACPACWPAYAGLLSALGLSFLLSTTYLFPLTAAFLALALAALRRGSLLAGLAASALLLAGKFLFASNPAMYGGAALLVAASIWNTRRNRYGCKTQD